MLKTLITTIFVTAIVLAGTYSYAPSAEAACSYTGYINSGGKCAKSFKKSTYNYNRYDDVSDDDFKRYEYRRDTNTETLELYILQLQRILEELLDRVETDANKDFDVVTRSATDIEADEALLRGQVFFGDSDEATVYFEYGTNRNDLDRDTTHIALDDSDNEYFTRRLINLRDDTLYYFRAVAEDEDGEEDYGSILSFRTDDESDEEEPDADTDAAEDITDDSAELQGSIDMNDYANGVVFFVYGEDEDQVADIAADYDAYSDIDEDGDDLQKLIVDTDLDNNDSYQEDITGLDNDTDIYFSICVEYEDEDNDETITCGGVEEFTTDN